MIEIKNRFTNEVLYSGEFKDVKSCLKAAIKKGVNLRGVNLSGVNLSGVNLRGADLRGADLRGVNLGGVKADLFEILVRTQEEVPELKKALIEGRIDGSCYEGDCACLVGTIANIRECDYMTLPGIVPDGDRPAEKFFYAIKKGDTPETNTIAQIVFDWINEFQELVPNSKEKVESGTK